MTSCPVCGKSVDPLRAPAVSVRDGKVVSYCSKDCAALADSGPAKLIPTKLLRLPSNEDTDRLRDGRDKVATPSSGVVTVPPPVSDPDIAVPPAPRDEPAQSGRRHKRSDSSSVQIADTGSIDDYITHTPSRRGLWISLVLLVVAGVAAAAYFLGYLDSLLGREPARVAVAVVHSDAAVMIDAPPALTAEEAITRAKAVLRAQLTATPRVQQLAAAALSRTGDAPAIELLAAAVTTESGDLAKIELAYQLARAGDKRGIDALVAAASPTKRESKHEAGHRFALLGDKRAIKVLEGSLPFPQFRLAVAQELAYLAEPRALKILDEVRADPRALPEEKASATIALGWAGRTDVVPALHELLADSHNNAYAAAALANLHDAAARSVLVQQLGITTLRVRAARGLRQLDPDADLRPLLPALLDALASQKDTGQVEIAEAILLLAGPPAWSAHE